jgi:uncharacterized protein
MEGTWMAFHFLQSFRQRLHEYKSNIVTEFYTHVAPLLRDDMVRQLDSYTQHYCYTRLHHSLDVAYYSFFITRLLGWDSRSTARAALLHDLFLYDRHADSYTGKHHATQHPRIALENARLVCDLNKREENIIRRHMWIITLVPPRYKEGFVVTFVDKFCAAKEFCIGLFGNPEAQKIYIGD